MGNRVPEGHEEHPEGAGSASGEDVDDVLSAFSIFVNAIMFWTALVAALGALMLVSRLSSPLSGQAVPSVPLWAEAAAVALYLVIGVAAARRYARRFRLDPPVAVIITTWPAWVATEALAAALGR